MRFAALALLCPLLSLGCATSEEAALEPIETPRINAKPEVLVFGEELELVRAKMEPLCTSITQRDIEPIQLPTARTSQIQLDCEGFHYAGAPRLAELVFADGVLELVWILVEPEELPQLVQDFRDLYGDPTHDNEQVTFFLDDACAVRFEPAEVLFLSERLKEPYARFLSGS